MGTYDLICWIEHAVVFAPTPIAGAYGVPRAEILASDYQQVRTDSKGVTLRHTAPV